MTTCVGLPGCPPSVLPSSINLSTYPSTPSIHSISGHPPIPSFYPFNPFIPTPTHGLIRPPHASVNPCISSFGHPFIRPMHPSHDPRIHAVTQPSNLVDHPSCPSSQSDSIESQPPRALRPINQAVLPCTHTSCLSSTKCIIFRNFFHRPEAHIYLFPQMFGVPVACAV